MLSKFSQFSRIKHDLFWGRHWGEGERENKTFIWITGWLCEVCWYGDSLSAMKEGTFDNCDECKKVNHERLSTWEISQTTSLHSSSVIDVNIHIVDLESSSGWSTRFIYAYLYLTRINGFWMIIGDTYVWYLRSSDMGPFDQDESLPCCSASWCHTASCSSYTAKHCR